MSEAPVRRASPATPRNPIVRLAGLAGLLLIVPLLRGVSPGTSADERAAKPPLPQRLTPTPPPTAPAARARVEVHALARLEPESGIVRVGVRPGVRIDRILVKEADEVAPGAELAVLEGRSQADLQVALIEAQKRSSDEQRGLARDKLALEREREDALRKERLEAQRRSVDIAERRFKAAGDIYKTLGQAAQGKVKYDLDLGYFQAEAELQRARIELKELQSAQDLIERRRRLEDRQVELQEPSADVLKAQLELARAGREQTTVLAPAAGQVLELLAHAGEVSAGPLLALGDLSSMVAIAEVYQSDVADVKPGDPAEVLVLGRGVSGKVLRVSRLVGRNTLASLDPRAPQDRRVVEVTVRLDEAEFAADYVNMEVEVTIRPQTGKPR